MKSMRVAAFVIIALAVLTPGAGAQPAHSVTVVQTATPVIPVYTGVHADVLGIRLGMTVHQAEAVAEKNYPGKPFDVAKVRDIFGYKVVTVQSQPYVQRVTYQNSALNQLSLIFSGPATGNRLYAVSRTVSFCRNVYSAKEVLKAPLISTLKAALIKKYGPPSYLGPQTAQQISVHGGLVMAWVFNNNSRLSCTSYQCAGRRIDRWPTYFWGSYFLHQDFDQSARENCGASQGSPAVFKIVAQIDRVNIDTAYHKSLASDVKVTMWDAQACVNDWEGARKQFEADAARLFPQKTAPMARVAPSGTANNVAPGSGPIAFYGDILNIIGSRSPRVVRPSTLLLFEDGSAALDHLRWSNWGTSVARASGVYTASSCVPNCANGKRMTTPVMLTLSSPGVVDGHRVYRCFRIAPLHPQRGVAEHECIAQQGGGLYSYTSVATR